MSSAFGTTLFEVNRAPFVPNVVGYPARLIPGARSMTRNEVPRWLLEDDETL